MNAPPVRCAAKGCKAQHEDNKFAAIRAGQEGWFKTRDGDAFCPRHVPAWVPAWRAKQAALQHKVAGSYASAPTTLSCRDCGLREQADTSSDKELLAKMRSAAFEHAKKTGHTVLVITSQVLTVAPEPPVE